MKSLVRVLAITGVAIFSVRAVPDPKMKAKLNAEEMAQVVCKKPFGTEAYVYADLFNIDFVQAIPEEYFRGLTAEALEATGTCETVENVKVTEHSGTFRLKSSTGSFSEIKLSLDENGQISGFRLLDVQIAGVPTETWSQLTARLNTLQGMASITFWNFGQPPKSHRGDEVQPIGSGFKLYILGALSDAISAGQFQWSQTFPIAEKWKSLPSGVMQTWPAGQMVSLYEYAENMIKISDNTATDHLLGILGRQKVELQVSKYGNSYASRNYPFLSTAEMFKLKWAAPQKLIEKYLAGTESLRRQIVDREVQQLSLAQVGTNGLSMSEPAYIQDIEWFGSTEDLCRAMQGLTQTGSKEVLDILGQNVPFLDLSSHSPWKYGGFKGGSEPGVLTMTYLVQSRSQRWGCISLAWHNSSRKLNNWIFYDLVRKSLKLAPTLLEIN